METVLYLILAVIALVSLSFYSGILYNRYQHSKVVKSISEPTNSETIPPEYNPDYLTAEKIFDYNGMVIDCHKQIEDGTYSNIFMDPNKAKSYSKFVIFPDLPDRNDDSFYSELDLKLNNLAAVVIKDTGWDIFKYWTHLLILAAGKLLVAYAHRCPGGTLYWCVISLADDCCWGARYGGRFLLRRLV